MKVTVIKYWLIVASKDHVMTGVNLSIAQACHGKCSPLQKMKEGDRVVYYSPKLKFEGGLGRDNKCNCFTALGTVGKEAKPYQVQMTEDFKPWRINVVFDKGVKSVLVKELVEELSFITNKKSWGTSFRNGFRGIEESDFMIIENAMKGNL